MKHFLHILLPCFMLCSSQCQGQISLEWINWFDLNDEQQTPIQFSLDKTDDLIIVGRDYKSAWYYNVILLKLNSSGSVDWYKTLIDTIDAEVGDLVCDKNGNSYVSMLPLNFYFNDPISVQKINTDGNAEWVDTTKQLAESITLDSDGNIYSLYSVGGIEVIKYDSSGNSILDFKNDTSSVDSFIFHPKFIKLDNENNILVSGTVYDLHDLGFFIKKFDKTGTLLWDTRYEPTEEDESRFFWKLDQLGNSYIATEIDYADGIALAKISSNGELIWEQKNTQPVGYPIDLILDKDGNPILSARYFVGIVLTYLIEKYDTNGNMKWSHTIDSALPSSVASLAVDSFSNIYAACNLFASNNITYDVKLFKFSKEGDSLLSISSSLFLDTNAYAHVIGITLDQQNNIYVVGHANDTSNFSDDIFTMKFSQNVGINNPFTTNESSLNIFPNPFYSTATIQLQNINSKTPIELQWFDLPGRLVKTENIHSTNNYTITREGINNGMYILKLVSENKIIGTAKIVVQ